MGAGGETTGKGSIAYGAINRFFQAEDRKAKQQRNSTYIAPKTAIEKSSSPVKISGATVVEAVGTKRIAVTTDEPTAKMQKVEQETSDA